MKRIILLLIVICCIVPSIGATELSDYTNYTTFYYNITESMGSQTDYQMRFILSNASGISGYYAPDNVVFTNETTRPDWNDINATDGSDTPLPFWIENNTQTAKNCTAWVKVPSIVVGNTSAGKWYYGNASQNGSTMSGNGTFIVWDDFNSAILDTSKWTKTASATATQSNGLLLLSSSAASSQGIYNGSYPVNRSITSRWKADTNTSVLYQSSGFDARVVAGTDFTLIVINSASSALNNFKNPTTSNVAVGTGDANYHVYTVSRNAAANTISYKDTSTGTLATNVPTISLPALINIYSSSGAGNITADWVFVRTYVYPEPTTSLYSTSSTGGTPPIASFTCTPTSTEIGTPIACTDTSSDTPTNWTYYWGDGNVTDGTQNPSYTYPFTGTFSINQTVNNTLGSSWYNRSNYITITNVTSFTQQDIYLAGQYTITFNVKSSTTNLPIANVTVVDSVSGQSYPSTNGTAFLTLSAGLYYITFIADGYQTKQVTYVVDKDEVHEVKMVPAETPNNPVYNVYPPKDVKFHITSFFGAPIQNANVTIHGITTSTGNWDWLVTLLGVSLDEVAINGTAMSESTDSNGDAVFLMLPSVKYNITTTATGYTFPTSFIAPQATEYTITANWNESWFSSGNDTLKDVNVSVSWVKYNDTYSFVNISYDDQTMTTTGGTIMVYRDSTARVANASAISTMDITSASCSNSTLVNTPTGGASYRVLVNATTTDQNIMRTFTHYFKGSPVTLPGWTSETLLWLALFIVIFTAAFAGAIHSPQMAIVLCVESWVFWAIGWLDALITQFWYGETAIIGVLVLASFLAVMWNITEGKSKVKRSS